VEKIGDFLPKLGDKALAQTTFADLINCKDSIFILKPEQNWMFQPLRSGA
jgi:hypothetical protein